MIIFTFILIPVYVVNCNRDMPLSMLCLVGTQRRSQPLTEDFIEEIAIMPFFRTYPMDYLLISNFIKRYNRFSIHPHRNLSGFLAHLVVKYNTNGKQSYKLCKVEDQIMVSNQETGVILAVKLTYKYP